MDDDPQLRRLTELMHDLADDPDAPPSSVTPLSVIRQAKRLEPDAPAPIPDRRSWFRRPRVLAGIAVAAGVVTLTVIVVPTALRSGDATSANSAAELAISAEPEAAGAATPTSGAADASSDAAMAAPNPSAQQEMSAAASDSPRDSAGGAGGAEPATCPWPPLPPDALAAAQGELPAGRFGTVGEFTGSCSADIIGGSTLVDEPTGLIVRVAVSPLPVGSCPTTLADQSEASCVPDDSGLITTGFSDGQPGALRFGDGYEVVVQAPDSPLFAQQDLIDVAEAVFATLS